MNGGNICVTYPMVLDSYCKEHKDCQSGFCAGGVTYNSCEAKKKNGYKGCAAHEECESGGCMDGYGVGNGGNVCKAFPFDNGSYCHAHSDCQSGYCLDGTAHNTCEPKRPNGYEGCRDNVQCESGGCMDGFGVGYGGNVCKPFPFGDGSYCHKHSDCKSNYCEGGVTYNSCETKLDNGKGCADHVDCKSGFCMDGYGLGNYGNTCEAYPLSGGKYCNENRDCRSGHCKSNWFDKTCT